MSVRISAPPRSKLRRAFGAIKVIALTFSLTLTLVVAGWTPAAADNAVSPVNGAFTINGVGYGHGWGMSQYGAYGAATEGLTWRQILTFYYTGVTLGSLSGAPAIDVWISSDNDNDLRVKPSPGLKVYDTHGHTLTLPTGSNYTAWRAVRSGSGLGLQYRNSTGSWVTRSTTLTSGYWSFANTAALVKVWLPNGSHREFRTTVRAVPYGTGLRTVNHLKLEQYLRSVVPSEMPASWHSNALRAQAVAARTYAARLQSDAPSDQPWDVCDTIACQVYNGHATTSGGTRTVHEAASTDSAIVATDGVVVRYGSALALTQFSSSNGGHSAQGDFPYLKAKPDPYDGVIKSQAWSVNLTTTAIKAKYPAVGTVQKLQVVSRDGYGKYGGRVTSIKIIGSTSTVTVTGAAFRTAFGLRSALFTVIGAVGTSYETFPRRYLTTSRADLAMITPSGDLVRHPVSGPSTLGPEDVLNTGDWSRFTHVVQAGDWNGDGYQDLVSTNTDHAVFLHRGVAGGGFSQGVSTGLSSWHVAATSPGDLNDDGHPDLLVITTWGNLYAYYGNGATGFEGLAQLASGWGNRNWLRSPGDWNGDGLEDVITELDGGLFLHRGTSGGFAAPVQIGSGWTKHASITSLGDFDNDGNPDVVARSQEGR